MPQLLQQQIAQGQQQIDIEKQNAEFVRQSAEAAVALATKIGSSILQMVPVS